jgi:hypothetical protein
MADVPLSEETLKFFEKYKEQTEKIEPVTSGLISKPDQEDFNYWNKAKALTLSAAQGVVNAVEEQGDFLDENIVSLGGLEFGDNDGKFTFKDLVPKMERRCLLSRKKSTYISQTYRSCRTTYRRCN